MKLSAFCVLLCLVCYTNVSGQKKLMSVKENKAFHDQITRGIKVFPGQWRPNFGSEQIAWISPPWPSPRPEYGQEFIYLDFPEAIKAGNEIVFLSHVHPRFPALYNYHLGMVKWVSKGNALQYKRKLPNGLSFEGSITVKDSSFVGLEIGITNNTGKDLDSIFLQTCGFLNPIQEFNSPVDSNKFVFIKDRGWTSFAEARGIKDNSGKYFFGWLGGTKSIALPFVVLKSKMPDHFLVFSWLENSYSFIGNAGHPCFHSDPWFPDLKNKAHAEIHGFLWFYTGAFSSLEGELRRRFSDFYGKEDHP